MSKCLRFLWRVNALQANFVLGVGGVKNGDGVAVGYVHDFADWVHQHMVIKDVQSLLNYRQASPSGARAHPSEDHLLPLFTALGAAGADARPEAFYRGISDYVIAMDGYAFH